MLELEEHLDKKSVSKYKSILKKMLTCISKFGSSKEKDDVVWLYHYIDKTTKEIHPVIFMYQVENPWGNEFYPARLFMVGTDFPPDINIFNTKQNHVKYHITKSALIYVSDFKKEFIDKLKELSIELTDDGYYTVSIPSIVYSVDYSESYVDVLANKSDDVKFVTSKLELSKFTVIDNEAELRYIHSKMADETQFNITARSENSKPLQLFYSIYPMKMNKFEYIRKFKISDNNVISIVYCKQTIENIIIHNFYKYADVWNLVKVGNNG